MGQDESTELDAKMSAQMLYDRGVDYFEQGDYLAARRDFEQAQLADPSADVAKKIQLMLKRLAVDPFEIAAGVVVLCLLTFLFVYFGLRS